MAINGKVLSVWKPAQSIYARQAGSWLSAKKAWVKNNGTWSIIYNDSVVPNNAIIFYSSISNIPTGSRLCNGLNGTPNLIGLYPMKYGTGYTNILSVGGSNSHAGSGHLGASNVSGTTNGLNTSSMKELTSNVSVTTHLPSSSPWWPHIHSIAHTCDSAVVSNEPLHISLSPYLGGASIEPGAVIFGTSSLSGLNYLSSIIGNYIKMSSLPDLSVKGSLSHSHNDNTFNSGTATTGGNSDRIPSYNGRRHSHGVPAHAHVSQNDPLYYGLVPHSHDKSIYFDDLQTGVVIFFTDSNIPQGWSVLASGAPGLLKAHNTEALGGRSIHGADQWVGVTGPTGAIDSIKQSSTVGGLTNRTDGTAIVTSHTHTANHSHNTNVNLLPQYVVLYAAVKN